MSPLLFIRACAFEAYLLLRIHVTSHTCISLKLIIMLKLCLLFSDLFLISKHAYYSQNYASIIYPGLTTYASSPPPLPPPLTPPQLPPLLPQPPLGHACGGGPESAEDLPWAAFCQVCPVQPLSPGALAQDYPFPHFWRCQEHGHLAQLLLSTSEL